MKKEWADKWIKALRSGEYSQRRERLREGNGYCCLGVLCDIVGTSWVYERKLGDYAAVYECQRSRSHLPPSVMRETGMRTGNGSIWYPRGNRFTLIGENDKGASFEKIADIIDKHWERL